MQFLAYIAISLLLTVAAELLRPKQRPPNARAGAVDDFDIPTAEEGRAIPYAAGTVRIDGPNVVWYGDLESQPIKKKVKTGLFSSSKVTVGFRYYLGLHFVLCHGKVDEIVNIRVGDKIPAGTVTVGNDETEFLFDDMTLFGGDESEGGVRGVAMFYPGSLTQNADSYMEEVTGEPYPAYRTISHCVFRKMYLGTSTYLKPISFTLKRFPNPFNLDDGSHIIGDDANAACVIYDLLTNGYMGANVPTLQMDRTSFVACAQLLKEEGLGLSMLFNGGQNVWDAITDVLRHVDGAIFPDLKNGKIVMTLIRPDFNSNPDVIVNGLTFTPAEITELEFSRGSWSETRNTIKVTYTDRDAGYTSRVAQVQDLANVQGRSNFQISGFENVDQETITEYANAALYPWLANAYDPRNCMNDHEYLYAGIGGTWVNTLAEAIAQAEADIGYTLNVNSNSWAYDDYTGTTDRIPEGAAGISPGEAEVLKMFFNKYAPQYIRATLPAPGVPPNHTLCAPVNVEMPEGPDWVWWSGWYDNETAQGGLGSTPVLITNRAQSGTIVLPDPDSHHVISCDGPEQTPDGLGNSRVFGINDIVVRVRRKQRAPDNPCNPRCDEDAPYEALPGDARYCLPPDGGIARNLAYTILTAAGGTFKALSIYNVDGIADLVDRYPLNPVLRSTDDNFSDEEFWTAAYDAAVLAGDLPGGMTYDAEGNGDETTYPRLTNVTSTLGASTYTRSYIDDGAFVQYNGTGEVVADEVDLPGITNSGNATKVAQRLLNGISHPIAKLKIRGNRKLAKLLPASWFYVDWPALGIENMRVRVIKANYGGIANNRIEIDAMEDVFGLDQTTFAPPPSSGWVDPAPAPVVLTKQYALEAPYAVLDGQTDRYLLAVATRDNGIDTGYGAWRKTAADVEYVNSNTVSGFTPGGALVGDYTRCAGDDDITIDGTRDMSSIAAPTVEDVAAGRSVLLIVSAAGEEFCSYSTLDNNGDGTWTIGGVKRGVWDTRSKTHVEGSRVYFFTESFGVVDEAPLAADENNVLVKLTPASPVGQLALASATAMEVDVVHRALRPYAPAKVRVNGECAPVLLESPLEVTWSERNRLDSTMVGDNDATVAPEAGVSYAVRLIDNETEDVLAEETVTGDSWTPSIEVGGFELRLEIEAQRDGLSAIEIPTLVFDVVVDLVLAENDDYVIAEDGDFIPLDIAPVYVTTMQVVFSGTFSVEEEFGAYFWIDGVSYPCPVSGAGKSSLADFATDLAAQIQALLTGFDYAEAIGETVTVKTTSLSSLSISNQVAGIFQQTQQESFPVQGPVYQALFFDLYEKVLGVWELAPASGPNYMIDDPGSSQVRFDVVGLTYAAKKAIGYTPGWGFGGKSYIFNWIMYPTSPSSARYTWALNGLLPALEAEPDFETFDITISNGTLSGGTGLPMFRSSITMTATGEYGVSVANNFDFQAPNNFSPCGYEPMLGRFEDGHVAYPAGAKQLDSLEFSLSPDFPLAEGQKFTVFLDDVEYTYTVTLADESFGTDIEPVFEGLKALIEPGGDFTLNYYDTMRWIEVERTVIDTPFEMRAYASYGSFVNVTYS